VSVDPLIGTVIDRRYRIESQLGTGGMGDVYVAEHLFVHDMVAIKVLRSEYSTDPDLRQRFLEEPRIAASSRHPNIIGIRDAGEEEGRLYVVMELVRGKDLKAVLQESGPLDPARLLVVIGSVASALDAAHASGLLHRDVKPANILIREDGHVFLTDFGIAKDMSKASSFTREGIFVGTLEYASPEQIRGEPLDRRTDVYSLGGVLYHCLAGEPPYGAGSDFDVMRGHVEGAPPQPRALRPELPEALDHVVARAMAKSRNDRYESCGELAEGLRRALQITVPGVPVATETRLSQPVTVAPPSEPTRLDTPVPAPMPAPASAPPPAKRAGPTAASRKLLLAGLAALAIAGGGAGLAVGLAGGDDGPTAGAASTEQAPAETPPVDTPTRETEPVDPGLDATATVDSVPLDTVALDETTADTIFLEPADDVQALLGHIPPDIRDTCGEYPLTDETTSAWVGALAAVLCSSPSGGATGVWYFSFSDGISMDTVFDGYLTGYAIPEGDCSTESTAYQDFTRNSGQAGRVLCKLWDNATASVIWTRDDLFVLGWADNSDGDESALWTFWEDEAGPL
jgi:serine/threonine-protein kinase